MALFGGSKSSSVTNLQETTNNTADNRVIQSGAKVGGNVTLANTSGDGVFNVTTTDFGALDAASEIVNRAAVSVDNAVGAVQTVVGDANASITGALNKVTDFATTQTGGNSSQTIQYLIIAVAIVGMAFAFKTRK